jgi:general secretion pathway protein D
MTSSSFRRAALRSATLGLVLLSATAATAQTQGRGNTTTRRPTTNTNRGGTTAPTGGGGGGSSSAGGNRQYVNSTMIGDAMITSDLETRRLIIVTDEDTNESIRTIVASLDKPKPQVLINVVFVQVSHDKGLDLGAEVSWKGSIPLNAEPSGRAPDIGLSKFGLAEAAADPTHFGAFYRVLGQDVNATIHALSTVGKTEILSRPSILTRNNQQATIMVGQSVPFIQSSRVSDIGNNTINTVTYEDIGIILRVTPFITAEGLVEMIVSPEISSLSATTVPISNTVNSPVIDKRSADTVVVTPSDKTVVIGGLISTQSIDRDSKVPILGDIPILGAAFKRKVKNDVKTELLIFLTPHVVPNPEDLASASASERNKMDLAPKAFPKADLDRYIGTP